MNKQIISLLQQKAAQYNQPDFIARDPISIPHRFDKKQDIEIAGFFAAILAWGQRTSIINSCTRLMEWMDNAPHQFIRDHKESDLKLMLSFVHRTFNATDLFYSIAFLQAHYKNHTSLEDAFVPQAKLDGPHIEAALVHFHNYFFSLEEFPERTRKHIATPARKSACKRLNMYLRWMVRKDNAGVDFGIWNKINPAQLICPLDVHVSQVAKRIGLLPDTKSNWKNALLLTEQLRKINPVDPCLYDYALFGLGVEEKYR